MRDLRPLFTSSLPVTGSCLYLLVSTPGVMAYPLAFASLIVIQWFPGAWAKTSRALSNAGIHSSASGSSWRARSLVGGLSTVFSPVSETISTAPSALLAIAGLEAGLLLRATLQMSTCSEVGSSGSSAVLAMILCALRVSVQSVPLTNRSSASHSKNCSAKLSRCSGPSVRKASVTKVFTALTMAIFA